MTDAITLLEACGPQDRPEVEAALSRWQAAELAHQLAGGRAEDVAEALQTLAAAGRLVDLAAWLLAQVVAREVEAAGGDETQAVAALHARERVASQAVRAELAGAQS